jgi:hypothetical protein
MSQFEDNLWRSVVDRHGDDLARADALVATQARRARPRLLAGASVAVAAAATAATAVTLLLGAAASPPPAFAVTRHQDGSVSVNVNRRSGVAGANRKLAAMGIHARVMAVGDGQSTSFSCVAPGPGPNGKSLVIAGYPKVATGPTSTPSTTSGNTGSGNTSTGGPAAGSTWHMVACSSVQNTGTTGTG